MKKFTHEEMLKKHETNIKSAVTVLILAGVLGLIFIVRYIFKGDMNFYFSLSFTEAVLMLFEANTLPLAATAVLIAVFLAVYLVFFVLTFKDRKWLIGSLSVYVFDFICLGASLLFLTPRPVPSECYIDVIFHLFIILFLAVGINSHNQLKKEDTSAHE